MHCPDLAGLESAAMARAKRHPDPAPSPALPPAAVALVVDQASLRPLIASIVRETITALEADRAQIGGDRFCWSEPEAAGLLGLREHQLRDERRRGRIAASGIVGRRIRYTRDNLLEYLARRRIGGDGT
jgi:hypothetical protein